MSKGMRAGLIMAGAFTAMVAVAGFFHSSVEGVPSPGPAGQGLKMVRARAGAPMDRCEPVACEKKEGGADLTFGGRQAWNLPTSGSYRRAADFQLKVKDSIKTDEELEARATKVGGTLLNLVLEGTEGARSGSIAFKIPSDKVNQFIRDVRELGKVQHERITAEQIATAGSRGPGEGDEREFSLVSVHFADEAIAPEIQRSRGLFAASFERSASHFLNGLAVLVELAGLVLPYAFALGLIVAPIALIVKMKRRARIVSIEEARM